jgi:hypothetical protein
VDLGCQREIVELPIIGARCGRNARGVRSGDAPRRSGCERRRSMGSGSSVSSGCDPRHGWCGIEKITLDSFQGTVVAAGSHAAVIQSRGV